jgi:hypothetical protein
MYDLADDLDERFEDYTCDENTKLHCENGPAAYDANGNPRYFLHGVEVTEDEIWSYGKQKFALRQKRRVATIHVRGKNGADYWFLPDGRLHFVGAPAVIRADGTKEFWEFGEFLGYC